MAFGIILYIPEAAAKLWHRKEYNYICMAEKEKNISASCHCFDVCEKEFICIMITNFFIQIYFTFVHSKF